MVSRETRRLMARQVFEELLQTEYSSEAKPELSRKARREQAWAKSKLMAKGLVEYAYQQALEIANKKSRGEDELPVIEGENDG